MPVTPDEFERYRKFTQGMMEHLESLKFDPETVLWAVPAGPSQPHKRRIHIRFQAHRHLHVVACVLFIGLQVPEHK